MSLHLSSCPYHIKLFHYTIILTHYTIILTHYTISWCGELSDRSHLIYPLGYFSFQPVFHNWCNSDRCMYCSVYRRVHIKDHLLLIANSCSWSGDIGFHISLTVSSLTICPTPNNHKFKQIVLSASRNKIFLPSFRFGQYSHIRIFPPKKPTLL